MNPNSAVERVKNHLAFKIGEVIESNNSRGGGRFILVFENVIPP